MKCSCGATAVGYVALGVKVLFCPLCDRIRCHNCRKPVYDGKATHCKCGANVSLSR